jgi:hypothetical protein
VPLDKSYLDVDCNLIANAHPNAPSLQTIPQLHLPKSLTRKNQPVNDSMGENCNFCEKPQFWLPKLRKQRKIYSKEKISP